MNLWGFEYTPEVEAKLRAGETFAREWICERTGHRHRTSLSWNEQHQCPHVSTLDCDLAIRLLSDEPPESLI